MTQLVGEIDDARKMCWSSPYIGERILGFMQTGGREPAERRWHQQVQCRKVGKMSESLWKISSSCWLHFNAVEARASSDTKYGSDQDIGEYGKL